MAKKKITAAEIEAMINDFRNGVNDTRRVLFEAYFGVNNECEIDGSSVSSASEADNLISGFLRSISVYVNGVGMNDKEYLRAEEKYHIGAVNNILDRNKDKAVQLLEYAKGNAADMGWLGEEEIRIVNSLSMPVLEFVVKKYIKENF